MYLWKQWNRIEYISAEIVYAEDKKHYDICTNQILYEDYFYFIIVIEYL